MQRCLVGLSGPLKGLEKSAFKPQGSVRSRLHGRTNVVQQMIRCVPCASACPGCVRNATTCLHFAACWGTGASSHWLEQARELAPASQPRQPAQSTSEDVGRGTHLGVRSRFDRQRCFVRRLLGGLLCGPPPNDILVVRSTV